MPDPPQARPRYVLVRMLRPDEAHLFGRYDVKLVGDPGSPELVDGRHEPVEYGRDGSAAEWMRLAELRDRLTEALEVMES